MKKVLILIMSGLFATMSYGQVHKNKGALMKRIEKAKIKYLKKQLKLTDENSVKFEKWYQNYQTKMKGTCQCNVIRATLKKVENDQDISESEAQAYLDELSKGRNFLVSTRNAEIKNLASLFSAKTALIFEKSEMEFKRKMIKKIRGKRKGWKKGKRKKSR